MYSKRVWCRKSNHMYKAGIPTPPCYTSGKHWLGVSGSFLRVLWLVAIFVPWEIQIFGLRKSSQKCFTYLLLHLSMYTNVHIFTCGLACTISHVWMSEDNSVDSVFSLLLPCGSWGPNSRFLALHLFASSRFGSLECVTSCSRGEDSTWQIWEALV